MLLRGENVAAIEEKGDIPMDGTDDGIINTKVSSKINIQIERILAQTVTLDSSKHSTVQVVKDVNNSLNIPMKA